MRESPGHVPTSQGLGSTFSATVFSVIFTLCFSASIRSTTLAAGALGGDFYFLSGDPGFDHPRAGPDGNGSDTGPDQNRW